jgi:transcription antitermination factor NusG
VDNVNKTPRLSAPSSVLLNVLDRPYVFQDGKGDVGVDPDPPCLATAPKSSVMQTHLDFAFNLYTLDFIPPELEFPMWKSLGLLLAEALPFSAMFGPTELSAPWIALILQPRSERKVESALARVGVETFVPWCRVRRYWSDRIKLIEKNLFPGYLFCRSQHSERHVVLSQPGVASVVSCGAVPALIPDEQIAAVRRTLGSGLPVSPWPFIEVGQRVRIESGVLGGLEGTLTREAGTWRVVINVAVLERSVAVEIDRDMVRPLTLASSR